MLFSEKNKTAIENNRRLVWPQMYLLLVLFLGYLLLALTACSRETQTDCLLAEIENGFYDSIPDARSLLCRLDSIPQEALDNDYRRERYGLLRAKGSLFCGDYPPDDSTLTAYVEFFRKRKDDKQLLEALIVRSSWNLRNRHLSGALADAFEARNIAMNGDDTLQMARAEKMLMFAFEPVYEKDSVLDHAQKCCSYYTACGRSRDNRINKRLVAVYLNAVGRTDEALVLMDSILRATPLTDSVELSCIYNRYIKLYVEKDSLEQAENAFRHSLRYAGKDFLWRIDWRNVLSMFFAAGKVDSVEHYLPIMREHYYGGDGNFFYYKYTQLVAESQGDYATAYHYTKLVDSINQFRHNVTVTQSPSIVISEYYNKKAQEESARVEARNAMIFAILAFSLTVIILLIVWLRVRHKRQQLREVSTMMELDSLREQLASAKIDKSVVESLFKSGFTSLDKLTTEYFIAKSTGRGTPESMVKSIEAQLEKLRSEESLDQVCEKIDMLYDGILTKIKVEIPKMKKADRYLIALKLAGFSPKSICLLLNLTPTNYYTKWQRIRNRTCEAGISVENVAVFE